MAAPVQCVDAVTNSATAANLADIAPPRARSACWRLIRSLLAGTDDAPFATTGDGERIRAFDCSWAASGNAKGPPSRLRAVELSLALDVHPYAVLVCPCVAGRSVCSANGYTSRLKNSKLV